MKFDNLYFLTIDLFHPIFTVICFCFKKGWCNYCAYYVCLNLGFFNSKTHVSRLLLIVIRTLEFLEGILIFTIITSFRYNEDKAVDPRLQIIATIQRLGVKSQETEAEGQGLRVKVKGQKTRVKGQGSKTKSQKSRVRG